MVTRKPSRIALILITLNANILYTNINSKIHFLKFFHYVYNAMIDTINKVPSLFFFSFKKLKFAMHQLHYPGNTPLLTV